MERDGEGFEIIKGFKENQQPPLNHKKPRKSLLIPKIVIPQYLQQQGGLSRASI